MERLTKAHYNGKGYYMICSEDCNNPADCIDCAALDNLVERLAAYEDTGLTPEEINGLQALWAERMKEVSELQEAKDAGRLVVMGKTDDPMSLDSLSLFLRNRADAVGELNEYDKMLMREASDRLAEAALKERVSGD